MKKFIAKNIWLLSLGLLLITSCAKKSDDPQPENNEPFSSALIERQQVVQIPTAFANNNTNRFAVETRGYINATNAVFTAYSGFLAIPANSTSNGNGSWTWTDFQGNQITYTSTLANGQYSVTMDAKFSDGTAYRVYEATERQDGTLGKITWFDTDGTAALVMDWKYENGLFTSTIVSDGQRFVSESNDNLSGTIKVYDNDVLIFTGTWQSTGAGECVSYNSDGTQNETGSW
ncbi:MAG TPA: hypothetical protein DCS93_17615 [Microscillaceae bacterium]|nr:hypothetical protein [Microscillaceae bacterium]